MIGFILLAGFILTGTVRTAGSLEPVPFARITVVELGQHVTAGAAGVYTVSGLPSGVWTLLAEGFGHLPDSARVDTRDGVSVRVDFVLEPAAIELAPLAARPLWDPRPARPGVVGWRLDPVALQTLPGAAEPDVLRALRDLPPVTSASDYSTGIYVRGGTPDQSVILLDGAPLLNPYHLGGALGAIDPGVVSAVEARVGGLPASAGDWLAGEIRIWTREGGRDRVRGGGGIGLLSSRLSLDGPLPGPGSFLVAWRRSYFDVLSAAARGLGLAEQDFPYAFTDVHAKATYQLGTWGKVSVSGYLDRERLGTPAGFEIPGEVDARWGTRTLSSTLRHRLAASLLSEFRVSVTRFDGRFLYSDRDLSPESLDADVAMDLVTGRAALTGYIGPHRLAAGVDIMRFAADYEIRAAGATMRRFFPPLERRQHVWTFAAFGEADTRLGGVEARAGARLLRANDGALLLLPRIGFAAPLGGGVQLVAAAGRHAQPLVTMRDEESTAARLFAYDLLLPAARVPTATELTVGLRARREHVLLSLDLYRKHVRDLPLVPPPSDPDEAPVLVADGRTAGSDRILGAEASLKYRSPGMRVTAGYALSRHTREVGDVRFTPAFARTHRLTVTASRSIGPIGVLGARLVRESGLRYTPVVGFVRAFRYDPLLPGPVPATDLPVLGEHNAGRLPGYTRIDLSWRRSYATRLFGKLITLTPYVQVFNLLNHRNVLKGVPRLDGSGPRLEYAPQLPFLPTFGIEWGF